jgi:hypothetical protein
MALVYSPARLARLARLVNNNVKTAARFRLRGNTAAIEIQEIFGREMLPPTVSSRARAERSGIGFGS